MTEMVVYFMGGPMDLTKRVINANSYDRFEVLDQSRVGSVITRHSYILVPMPCAITRDRVYAAVWDEFATKVEVAK